jgi:hypothetical protein
MAATITCYGCGHTEPFVVDRSSGAPMVVGLDDWRTLSGPFRPTRAPGVAKAKLYHYCGTCARFVGDVHQAEA